MSHLEELLRTALDGSSPADDEADRDLHEEVREASIAVESITDGLARLQLVRPESLADDTIYRVVIQVGDENRPLAAVAIPFDGYPIRFSPDAGQISTAVQPELVLSRDGLRRAFEKMATDRQSHLVSYLAFIVRNREALSAPGSDE